jgi:hypothetical protein
MRKVQIHGNSYDKPLIVYKRGTRGEVFTEYKNLNELVQREILHSGEPEKKVYYRFVQNIRGICKHSKCFHLGYDVSIRVKHDVR